MKKLLTVCIIVLFTTPACAQVFKNPVQAGGATGNIVYNVSPLPPVLSGGNIVYPSGTAMVANGQPAACNGPLTIDNNNNNRIACNNPVVQSNNAADVSVALANLAPAAGGAHALTDRNLSNDGSSSLRNDRGLMGAQ